MKIETLPYRKRLLYLVIAWTLFIVVAYHLAIKKTITLYRTSGIVTQDMMRIQNAEEGLIQTAQRLADLDNYLVPYILDSLKDQQYIMSEISELCKTYHLTLKHFPKAGLVSENDFTVETNNIEIEGGFANLLKLIYALETRHKIGRISSANFKSYMDPRSKKTILSLIIYLQNVRSNDKD